MIRVVYNLKEMKMEYFNNDTGSLNVIEAQTLLSSIQSVLKIIVLINNSKLTKVINIENHVKVKIDTENKFVFFDLYGLNIIKNEFFSKMYNTPSSSNIGINKKIRVKIENGSLSTNSILLRRLLNYTSEIFDVEYDGHKIEDYLTIIEMIKI